MIAHVGVFVLRPAGSVGDDEQLVAWLLVVVGLMVMAVPELPEVPVAPEKLSVGTDNVSARKMTAPGPPGMLYAPVWFTKVSK